MTALAQLRWLIECGADEALGDEPVDRYALAEARPAVPAAKAPPVTAPAALALGARAAPESPVARAEALAAAAADLPALRAAMEAFDCDLKAGARSFVAAEGTPGAALMIVGEAPGRDEDREGRPFAGEAGALLDRMLAAIGRDRADPDPARSAYLTGVVPWRPTGPLPPAALDRWRPFLLRHIALARPRVLLLLGNAPLMALMGRGGLTQMRGRWHEAAGLPAMATLPPAAILAAADPARRREAREQAWADLQTVRDRLKETP